VVERLVASSLRNRLLALVLGGVAVAWIGAAVFAYRDARHEAGELLDGYLAQSAALIVTQAGGDLDDLEVEHAPQLHRYARRVAFQIWDDGKTLRTHSVTAPDRRLSPRTEGFDEVEVNGQTWRVFSSYDPQRKILVRSVRCAAHGMRSPCRCARARSAAGHRAARAWRVALDCGDAWPRSARCGWPGGRAARSCKPCSARCRVASA
jgi:two-component system sensor histidine kinase QseC